MNKKLAAVAILALVLTTPTRADELNTRSVLGGGIGGALGALIGSEIGGRDGAVLGGGLGGALGSVLATDGYGKRRYVERHYYYPAKRGKHYRHRYRGDWRR